MRLALQPPYTASAYFYAWLLNRIERVRQICVTKLPSGFAECESKCEIWTLQSDESVVYAYMQCAYLVLCHTYVHWARRFSGAYEITAHAFSALAELLCT